MKNKIKALLLINFCLANLLMWPSTNYAQQSISPSFIEMESKFVEEDDFSITFPSIPRKTVLTQEAEDNKVTITSYQANDGLGLYTFSWGELENPLKKEGLKKYFVENLFTALVSTAQNAKIYTKEQSNKIPYDLSYLYTNEYRGIKWAHMGMILLANEKAYIKITLVYPADKIDIAEDKYSEFLNSLKLKK